MAEIECLNHTGLSVPDTRAGRDFYETILGGQVVNFIGGNSDELRRGRGVPHPMMLIGDYAVVVLVARRRVADDEPGPDAFRQAFAVPRVRFAEIIGNAQAAGVPFRGPTAHPDDGPLGESIYLKDPGGNQIEICWRRDEGQPYVPYTELGANPLRPATVGAVRPDLVSGVVIEVQELERSRAFYERVFAAAGGQWESGAESMRFRAGEQRFEMVRRDEPRNRANGGEHQAYRVGADRVDALAVELQAAGYEVSRWAEDHPSDHAPSVYVKDPSGNQVQLVAADPARGFLDHVGIAVHEMEDAEAFYGRALGGTIEGYYGWSTDDVLAARAGGIEDPSAAPWTRRATMSFRTHRLEPLPAAQLFLRFGGTRIDVFLTGARIPEPPEEQVQGTPRVLLRTRLGVDAAVRAIEEADASPVYMKRPKRIRFERTADQIYVRDPSGNFLELESQA